MRWDVKTYNIYAHSVSFFFIFAAFHTASGIGQTVLKRFKESYDSDQVKCFADHQLSRENDTNEICPDYQEMDNYLSNVILYFVFGVSSWLVPTILKTTGTIMGMFIGGVSYIIYILAYVHPNFYVLWVCSIIVGFGAGMLWTSQGTFLTENGTPETKDTNASMFWAFMTGGALVGNIVPFFAFKGGITDSSRAVVFVIFAIITAIGVLAFLALKKPEPSDNETRPLLDTHEPQHEESELDVLKRSFAMLYTRPLALVLPVFSYSALSLVMAHVVTTCIGGSKMTKGSSIFGDMDTGQLQAIAGVFLSLSQVTAGIIAPKMKINSQLKMAISCAAHVLCYLLCWVNFDEKCPSGDNWAAHQKDSALSLEVWKDTNYNVALLTISLVGFGDGMLNTQVYFYLSSVFVESETAPAFGTFKSVQSFVVAIIFAFVGKVPLGFTIIMGLFMTVVSMTCYRMTRFVGPAASKEAVC